MSATDTVMRRQLLKAMLATTAAVAAGALGIGALVIVMDLAETDDPWHGFGMFLGGIVAVPAVVVCTLAWVGFRSARRQLAVARLLGGVLGGMLMLPMPTLGAHWTSGLLFVLGLLLAGSALVARDDPSPADR